MVLVNINNYATEVSKHCPHWTVPISTKVLRPHTIYCCPLPKTVYALYVYILYNVHIVLLKDQCHESSIATNPKNLDMEQLQETSTKVFNESQVYNLYRSIRSVSCAN